MAGCFGNHPFDRAMEQQLMRHLDEESSYYCEECSHKNFESDIEEDEETKQEFFICSKCNATNYLN